MNSSNDFTFLQSAAETAALVRSIDWKNHSLGPPDSWSQTLKTSLGILFNSRHPMFLWWGKELIQFYNDAYLPSFGTGKHPKAMGQKGEECWPEIWPIIWPQIKDVLNEGKASWNENQLIPIFRNGKIEDVYWTYGYSAIVDVLGVISGVLVVCTETTKQVTLTQQLKVAELKDRELNNELIDVLENMSDAFFTIDSNWIVRRVNTQFEKVLKTKRDDVIGKSLIDLYFHTPELKESLYIKSYSKSMVERTFECFEDYFEPLNIWTAVSVYPKQDGGLAVFLKEVTQERLAAKNLREAIVARDVFIGIASHELNTPLTSLKLQGQMSQRLMEKEGIKAFDEEKIKKMVDGYLNQTNRLSRLVADMLDGSRIESGKLRLSKTPTNLSKLVEDVIEHYVRELNVSTKFSTSIEPNLFTEIDGFRIEQVLINSITNAIKYAPDSPIDISIIKNENQIVIVIKDYGPGIPLEQQANIFNRFVRGTSREEVSGLGLGLYISKKIIEAHEGTMEVLSGPGVGAEFIITIPRRTIR